MNRHHAIAIATLAALGFASQAQAQSREPGLTRDQVRAEYVKARDQGHLPVYGELSGTPPVAAAPSTLTRAQVHQELMATGPLPTAEGADSGISPRTTNQRSRAEVQAEAVRAMRAGTIVGGEV